MLAAAKRALLRSLKGTMRLCRVFVTQTEQVATPQRGGWLPTLRVVGFRVHQFFERITHAPL